MKLNLKNGSKAQRDGLRGENIVKWYLRFRGYRVVAQNYRVGHKEIDLIVQRGKVLAFVEVKSRHGTGGIPAQFSVGSAKRRNIVFAAKVFILNNRINNMAIRFDIAEVDLYTRNVKYYENAFYA